MMNVLTFPQSDGREARPLAKTPFIVNRGQSADVYPNTAPVRILDTEAKCALIGEMLSICVAIECGPVCRTLAEGFVEPYVLPRIGLQWSLGAVTFRAILDARNGMIVSVPADDVKVDAWIVAFRPTGSDPDRVGSVGGTRVGVGVGYGGGTTHEAARLTEIVSVEPGAIGNIPIPAFASGFALAPVGVLGMTTEAIIGGAGPYPTYVATSPELGPSGFPLPNGTRCLRFDNTDGTDRIEGFVIFALDL